MPPELWHWKYRGLDTLGALNALRWPSSGFLWSDDTRYLPIRLPPTTVGQIGDMIVHPKERGIGFVFQLRHRLCLW